MNAVLGAVLFAGVTLPPLEPAVESPFAWPYAEPAPVEGLSPATPIIPRTPVGPAPERRWDDRRGPGQRARDRRQAQPAFQDPARDPVEGYVPLPPTEPDAAAYPLPNALPGEGGFGTAEAPGGERVEAGAASGGLEAGYLPMLPTSPRSRYRGTRDRRYGSRERQTFATGQFVPNRQPAAGAGNVYAPPTAPQKPFADYRPPPTVSPYLNLFSDATGIARPDNYYTLVRPFLEQRNANRRIGAELQGLQRDVRRLHTPRGGGTLPARYQNLGGYYPGFDRR